VSNSLKKNKKLGTEALVNSLNKDKIVYSDLDISISTDSSILSVPKQLEQNLDLIGSEKKNADSEGVRLIFKKIQSDGTTTRTIKDYRDESLRDMKLGTPLIIKGDPAAILPLAHKNDPSLHLGYFAAVDNDGSIIGEESHREVTDKDLKRLRNKLYPAMNAKAKEGKSISNLREFYENKLLDTIKNYIDSTNLPSLTNTEELNKIN
jgi:hypothetical protein